MQLRPDEQLIHPGSGRSGLKVADPSVRALHAMRDRLLAQRVKAVTMDPQVRIRDANAAHPGILQPPDAVGDIPVGDLDQTNTARSHALPAGIADLAAQGEGGLEPAAGLGGPSIRQVDRSPSRLPEEMSDRLAVYTFSELGAL